MVLFKFQLYVQEENYFWKEGSRCKIEYDLNNHTFILGFFFLAFINTVLSFYEK